MSRRYVKSEVKSGASDDLLAIGASRSARVLRPVPVEHGYMALTPSVYLNIVGTSSKVVKVRRIEATASGFVGFVNLLEQMYLSVSLYTFTSLPAYRPAINGVALDSDSPSYLANVFSSNRVVGITNTKLFYQTTPFSYVTTTTFAAVKFFSKDRLVLEFESPITLYSNTECLEIFIPSGNSTLTACVYWTEE